MEWERERKEKQDSLHRFLATWEKLHAGSEAPPTAPPPRPMKTASKKRQGNQKTQSEKSGERKKEGEKMEERERGVESTNSDEEDVVEDFHFSSSDSDSD